MNMYNKILAVLLVIAAIIIVFAYMKQRNPNSVLQLQLQQKFETIKLQYEEAKAKGYDVSRAESLGKEAMQAYNAKDYKKAGDLLDQAKTVLDEIVTPSPNPASIAGTWLDEGAVYETHPYYYPNHSFKEITVAVPKIKELGAKTIYLMPIWERAMDRQDPMLIYLINDYYKIDPAYGSTDDLRELIDASHKNGLKILFDLVTCCTPPNSVVYNNNWTYSFSRSELDQKAKELNWKLEYGTIDGRNFVFAGKQKSSAAGGKDLYEFAGEINGDRIMARSYPIAGWGPAVDLGNPDVIKYFTQVAEYYVKEYDIDGWRIDAPADNYNSKLFSGDHSSEKLLTDAINAIKKIKPNAEFISEPGLAKEVPAELEYANLPRSIPDIIADSITSRQFVDKLEQGTATLGKKPLLVLESHDQSRLNRDYIPFNKNLLVMIATLPGVPFMQAGQEIGEKKDWFRSGNSAPEVDWVNGDYSLRDFYKNVLNIRNSNSALKYGEIKNVWKSGDNAYAYSRSYEKETVIMAINFKEKQIESILDVPFEKGVQLIDELSGEMFIADDPANFKISIPGYGSRILIVR